MKKSGFKIGFYLFLITILAMPFSLGCGSKKSASDTSKSAKLKAGKKSENGENCKEKLKFKCPDGKEALVIKLYNDSKTKLECRLDDTAVTLKGKKNSKGKVKYANESSGAFIAEVKFKPNGFKLRDESGKLIWKIKIKPDKLKISDNEEGDNAFEIKYKSDKAKVKTPDGNQIGKVKLYPDKGKIKVKDASEVEKFYCKTGKKIFSAGVLLFNKIQPAHRAIIVAELIKQGL